MFISKEHLLICVLLRSHRSTGQYTSGHIWVKSGCEGAVFETLMCVDQTWTSARLQPLQLSCFSCIICHYSGCCLLFFWYIEICPQASTLTALGRSQRTILLGEESHMSPWNQKQEISNNKKLTQHQLDCLQLQGNVRKTRNHECLKGEKKVLFFLFPVVRGGPSQNISFFFFFF